MLLTLVDENQGSRGFWRPTRCSSFERETVVGQIDGSNLQRERGSLGDSVIPGFKTSCPRACVRDTVGTHRMRYSGESHQPTDDCPGDVLHAAYRRRLVSPRRNCGGIEVFEIL